MNKLYINLQNCYGISNLEYTFDFEKSKVYSIYASNGMMKTSFAKTFLAKQRGEEPKDELFHEARYGVDSSCEILVDGNEIDSADIQVIKSFDTNVKYENLANLLVDDDTKEKIDELLKMKNVLLKELSKLSGLKNDEVEGELKELFGWGEASILKNLQSLKDQSPTISIGNEKYKDLVSLEEKILSPDFQSNIQKYVEQSDEIYDEYTFFQKGAFTLTGLKNIQKSLKNEAFFDGDNNNITLAGDGYTKKELGDKIKEIDVKLKATDGFKKVEKILATAGGKKLQIMIEKNPQLLGKLSAGNYENLKKSFRLSYIQLLSISEGEGNLIDDSIAIYNKTIQEISEQKIEETPWYDACRIFNERFSVPFVMDIQNKEIALIGEALPKVVFKFFKNGDKEDEADNNMKVLTRENLDGIDVLSQGEKRALYLLHIIFDIEVCKKKASPTLFIIDDIADSFDYKNKYAIIEYLYEITQNESFRSIILSHNFDFYRNIQSRLNVISGLKGDIVRKGANLSVSKNDGVLALDSGCDLLNVIHNCKNSYETNNFALIALIPVARNLVEYMYGCEDLTDDDGTFNYYKDLTNILHQLDSETNLKELFEIYSVIFEKPYTSTSEDSVKSLIHQLCKEIVGSGTIGNLLFEKKIVLSIGIRLLSESFMISKGAIADKESNFTRGLYNNATTNNLLTDSEKGLINRVLLMTPESIHVNSFMYEPIIDLSENTLISLYKELSPLI